MRNRRVPVVIVTLVAVAALAGYVAWRAAGDDASPPAAADTTAAERPDESSAALTLGNAAYRAGHIDSALAHYRTAASAAPSSAAAYFGIYMSARHSGNAALADSARTELLKRVDTSRVAPDSVLRAPRNLQRPPG